MRPSAIYLGPGIKSADLGGNIFIGIGSISQLAIDIISPAPERALGFSGTGMIPSGIYLSPGIKSADLGGSIFIAIGSISQLARGIISPAPERVIGFSGAGMIPSAIYLGPGIKSADLSGILFISSESISQLARGIISPAPERVIGFSGAGMIESGIYLHPGIKSADLGGILFISSESISQLAIVIISPAPECAIGFSGAGMIRSGIYPCPGSKSAEHLAGRNFISGSGSISQLARGIISPAPERAVAFSGAGMIPSAIYLSPGIKSAHLGGILFITSGSISQLAQVIPSPAPERAIGSYSTGVIHSCADLVPENNLPTVLCRSPIRLAGGIGRLDLEDMHALGQGGVGLGRFAFLPGKTIHLALVGAGAGRAGKLEFGRGGTADFPRSDRLADFGVNRGLGADRLVKDLLVFLSG